MKMVLFKSKIKWIALLVLILSTGSLVIHLSITKFSSSGILPYNSEKDVGLEIPPSSIKNFRNPKLWGVVKPLQSLQPYANPRSSYPAPKEKNNGYIYAKIFGGFEKIRSSICDLVTISRLLNATLVIPEIQESLRSKGVSSKFKSFSYLYDEEQFIASLKNDIIVVKSLPDNLKAARKKNAFPTLKPKSSASPNFYFKDILPKLKKAKVIGLVLADGGCLQSILPPSMYEFQRLRCRVAFHALQFRPEIQVLGHQMVERLRARGQPFLAFHPGLVQDKLAYHGCAELFQDVHTELIQYRRAQMIKQGILSEELSTDSHLLRENGSCPLMPEEVGLLLRAMGYPPTTTIYVAGSETFGGQRVLIPLHAMFANVLDRTLLCNNQELSDLVGPETLLPLDSFRLPPPKSEEQLKEEWKKAGPRPRPLPPPPDRPIYRHEKEGWYGWITETDVEPDPSPMDLRRQAHRLLWDALDYLVSLEADAYFPGFSNDGSGWPDFSSLVMGQRLYESAASRTYRPDRKILAKFFKITRDNMYHPKQNWTLSVREHLNKSLREDGLIQQSLLSKPTSFLSHPLPECSCRISSSEFRTPVEGNDGRYLYGGEDECPEWIQRGQEVVPLGVEGGKYVENESENENDVVQQESDDSDGKSSGTLPMDQDDEWDPND
ncbi:protein EMBRYO SAC DEVELOPMENT ARREST 30 [Ricinus communis]|uniref:protein EMBRYO SAC DEVELOPMENT ARREST 30 n=1 Tax=Ricinus communis TaxID=3988 RepID=UPI00201AFDC3|nr:protein EMBRYO SAC DEVELOPMENT ARREST 30 [Ricinus communis]XP_048225732.1 protein EMBRYO SAC DEVELOPMENT ARREST 30 [Ricinus communis]